MERDELLNINWDQSMDQSSQFESALSSIVSSPSNPTPPSDNVVIRELIGRLGSICNNSSDVSPRYNSATTSCYSTPLNSPPRLGLSVADHPHHRVWGGFSADPGFAERAAMFSCFNGGGRGYGGLLPGQFGSPEVGKLSRVSSSKSLKIGDGENGTGREEQAASVSDHVVQRKRKAASSRTKPKGDVDEANGKKTRSLETKVEENDGVESGDGAEGHGKEGNSKPPEPPKLDYIHVRARRGQATDSHSLAERVRREKISERMKFLQNLVPGCNKVTGKAVMLDEIINYVQSLQRQVEFLSMKLATVDPRQDFESFIQKDMHGTPPHSAFPMDTSAPTFPFSQHDSHPQSSITSGLQNPMDVSLRRSMGMQLPMLDGLGNNASLVGTMWEDDLESVVQMGVNSQIHEDQLPFTGQLPTTYMKVEL